MKKSLYIILPVLLLWACDREADNFLPDTAQGKIVLKMQPEAGSVEVRATEPGDDQLNENKITNIHVFIFPQNAADNQPCLRYETFTGLSFQGTGTFSKELLTSQSSFSPGVTYDIYTVVNLPSDVAVQSNITFGALKSLRTLTPVTSHTAQSSFVMDGKVSAILNPTPQTAMVNVSIPLKRAMSKIRVKFSLSSVVAGATIVQVSLRHFAKYGVLLDNNPYVAASGDYGDSPYVTGTPLTTFTFYCYENNWGTSSVNETYLMVNVPYGTRLGNYYRIPVNKYAGKTETGRVARNMIYDVTVYIDSNGSDSESGTVSINGNCTITDWTTRQIVLKTINQHYLGINEYNIVMANIVTYTLNYVSDLPVSITNITASCIQYNTSGVSSNVTYTSGQSQFPVFTVNAATSTITISSSIPINYVPKNITFTVTNNQGLSLNATVVQYPVRYVTARISTGNIKPEWFEGGTNLNLFTVNTLVPSSTGAYTLGDPTNGYPKTDSTANGNKMVSPRFIIASQYGIYNRVTYSVAQLRCLQYGEDIYRSGWRMPTKAEIELINTIQDDPNSAVKGLLTGEAYWSAYKYDYYNFTGNSWVSTNATGTAYIRAVYDLYKDEQ